MFVDDNILQSDIACKTDMEALQNSRFHLAIYPEKIVTGVLLEIGWSMAWNKPTLVFVKNEKDLPFILHKADRMKNINISIREYKDFEHLLAIICQYKRTLFYE